MNRVIYTQRVEVMENYKERRDCADQNIARFIKACGYLPIPVNNIPENIKDMVLDLKPSGIMLTGGNSIEKYGGNAPEKDDTDRLLIQLAMDYDIPLYGFCRGMQSILDYFNTELVEVMGHVKVEHVILGEIGDKKTNSFHKQAAYSVAYPLVTLAKTDDGVIEAVKHAEKKILATMWHPEREIPFHDYDIERVKQLFKN